MKLTAKFGEQEMKLQTKFGSSQTKIPSSVGSVTFVGGGGGGGECECVTSWNELEDKPFEYIPPISDIQWDGVIGDKFAIDLTPFGYQNMYFVKVSDEVFTAEELVGATYTPSVGNMHGINENIIDKSTFPGSLVVDGVISVCYSADDLNAAIGAPSGYVTNGTYFLYQAGVYYVSRLVLPAVRILWDGNLDGRPVIDLGGGSYLCKVSDDVYSKEQIIASVLSLSDTFSYVVTEDLLFSEPGFYGTSDTAFVYSENDANITLGFPQGTITNGVWFFKGIYSDSEVFYTTAFSPNTLKTLDEKFIPDTIARKSDIPESSSGVQSVNGVSPDGKGNVEIPVGVTSWNDLTDKPFGGDIIRQSFVDAVNIPFSNGQSSIADNTLNNAIRNAGGFIEGKTYEVSIDGEMYECVCVDVPVSSMTGIMYAKELHSVGEHGVNIKYNGNLIKYYTIAPVADGSHSVAICELYSTVKTLDEKYIPDTIARKEEIPDNIVQTVNGVAPDGNGNVEIDVGAKSWNDLEDKPFGEGPSRWVFVAGANGLHPTLAENGRYSASVEMMFEPKNRTKYKIVVKDASFGFTLHENECLGSVSSNAPTLGFSQYNLGGSGDRVRAYASSKIGKPPTLWFFEFQSSQAYNNGYDVEIYEGKPTLILLEEKFLSEAVVLESELESKGYQNEEQVKALIDNSKAEIVNDVIASLPIYNGEVEKV